LIQNSNYKNTLQIY